MINILKNKCTNCRLCMTICPSKIIRENKDGYPEIRKRAEPFCIKCGHCFSICPSGAVEYEGVRAEDSKSEMLKKLPADEILSFIKSRRSVRHFKETEVNRKLLEQLIDLLGYVPSGSNSRMFHTTVVSGKEKTDLLTEMVVEWAKENKQFIELVSEMRRGNNVITCGAPHLIIAHSEPKGSTPKEDSVIALNTIELAASAQGIGTCWGGFFTNIANQSDAIKSYLKIEESHKIYGTLMLGYPQHTFKRRPVRPKVKTNWI